MPNRTVCDSTNARGIMESSAARGRSGDAAGWRMRQLIRHSRLGERFDSILVRDILPFRREGEGEGEYPTRPSRSRSRSRSRSTSSTRPLIHIDRMH